MNFFMLGIGDLMEVLFFLVIFLVNGYPCIGMITNLIKI